MLEGDLARHFHTHLSITSNNISPPLHFQSTSHAPALVHYKFAAGVSSALPLAPFLQGFLLVQNSPCLEGLQACTLMRRCHFSALHVGNTSTRQAQECFPCAPGQETQWWNKFRKGVFAIEMCHTFKNTTQFFCMWLLPIFILALQETWTARPLFILPYYLNFCIQIDTIHWLLFFLKTKIILNQRKKKL